MRKQTKVVAVASAAALLSYRWCYDLFRSYRVGLRKTVPGTSMTKMVAE